MKDHNYNARVASILEDNISTLQVLQKSKWIAVNGKLQPLSALFLKTEGTSCFLSLPPEFSPMLNSHTKAGPSFDDIQQQLCHGYLSQQDSSILLRLMTSSAEKLHVIRTYSDEILVQTKSGEQVPLIQCVYDDRSLANQKVCECEV